MLIANYLVYKSVPRPPPRQCQQTPQAATGAAKVNKCSKPARPHSVQMKGNSLFAPGLSFASNKMSGGIASASGRLAVKQVEADRPPYCITIYQLSD